MFSSPGRRLAPRLPSLGLMLVLMSARTTGAQESPSVSRSGLGPPRWFPGTREYREPSSDRAHYFLAGGFTILMCGQPDGPLALGRWGALTAGADLPTGHSWNAATRLQFSNADGSRVGHIVWTRLVLGARFSESFHGTTSYYEPGLGMGVMNYPIVVADTAYQSHREQRTAGTPLFQMVLGRRWSSDHAAAFMVESNISLGLGAAQPGAIELVAGVAF